MAVSATENDADYDDVELKKKHPYPAQILTVASLQNSEYEVFRDDFCEEAKDQVEPASYHNSA
ncbi:3175_t:CDS:2, partial [Ambispora gerdemannii]